MSNLRGFNAGRLYESHPLRHLFGSADLPPGMNLSWVALLGPHALLNCCMLSGSWEPRPFALTVLH